jgi:dTMP kinase
MSEIKRGKFLSFEGVDGAGKSSHIPWLANLLSTCCKDVITTREPGGTPLGEKLRAVLITDHMHAKTEALLMYAARVEHVKQVIEPALARGAWVISDRFADSSYAYQGGGREVNFGEMFELEGWALGNFKPDLTFLFDLPVEVAQQRMTGTRAMDKFEVENYDFHMRVKMAFLDRARDDTPRIKIIDATKSIEDIRVDLIKYLQEFQNNILELGQLA